jgi:dolichol-phosphate mannosyltransferase
MPTERHNEQILVVIPTYNEAENITHLITHLENTGCVDSILVIDDNSPDGTAQKIRQLQQTYPNIHLHQRPRKMGLGTALKEGYQYALNHIPFTRLIQMDADLSHDPAEIPKMLKSEKDVVLGSRYTKSGKVVGWNLYRRILSRSANTLAKKLLRINAQDLTTGYRTYTKRAIETITKHLQGGGYQFQVESLWLSKRNNLTIEEVPITFKERLQGKSKLAGIRETLLLLRFLITHIK